MEAITRKSVQAGEVAREYATTLLVLLFIFNGLATFLILFDKIEVGQNGKRIVGALAFGFSVLMFMIFTNRGVKKQRKGK